MLFAGLFAVMLAANTEVMIPEGTILPIILNENLNTARLQENDPVLFSLADDIRTAGHRGPVLIPRGSSVVGRVVMSDRAGHFIGRSHMDIRLQTIVTPNGNVYDGVSAKVVDVAKKKGEKGEVRVDGQLQGPVHRTRDTFFLLFPPTTLFQLLAIPKRGPDIVLPVESRLYVKLMNPIYIETAPTTRIGEVASPPSVAPVLQTPVAVAQAPIPVPQPVPQAYAPLSTNGIEILVSPVALYPDAILRDLFRATTHPLEMAQANQWVHQRRDVRGSLPLSGYNETWDPSVKALTAYPDLLQRLTADVDWMMKLGSAYQSQPVDVMNAVQRMRTQANSFNRPTALTAAVGR